MTGIVAYLFESPTHSKSWTGRERDRVTELLHHRVTPRRLATALARFDRNIANGVRPDSARDRVVKWALCATE